MKYLYLLFDADDTLFDFQASAYKTFAIVCKKFNIPENKELYEIYHKINQDLWDLNSKGLISKSDLLINRFKKYFELMNFSADPYKFNAEYLSELKNHAYVFEDVFEVLDELRTMGAKCELISNGTREAQRNRLNLSGLIKKFEHVFISEEVGFNKPDKRFFDYVEKNIDGFDKEKALVIGDSLISDITGGINAGIDVCWFNPKGISAPVDLEINYTIKKLSEIINVIE